MKTFPFRSMNAFRILLFGQSISLLGTGMTRFAVMIWAFELDGRATTQAMLGFFISITYIIASPFAGVLVDRWNRCKVMLFADLGAGLMTASLLGLFSAGRLEIWHLYLAQGMAGIFEAFQDPAFSASISLTVPRDSLTRVNGLLGLGKSASRVFAPALAGLVQATFGLNWVMVVDLLTLSLAVIGLLVVFIPKPSISEEGRQAAGSFGKQVLFGAGYIFRRPGLRGLLLTFFMVNLFGTLTYFAIHSPMILARTGGDEVSLGIVRSMMGVGGIAGGLVISVWGGTRRKTTVYLWGIIGSFFLGDLLTAVSHSTTSWASAGFLAELFIPFIVSPYFAIWQEKIPADVQGRVFSTRETVQMLTTPVGYLLGGFLADRLFEPAMQTGGMLAGLLGGLIGTGPGAGMAAMFLITGICGALIGGLGLMSPSIQKLDEEELVAVEDAVAS